MCSKRALIAALTLLALPAQATHLRSFVIEDSPNLDAFGRLRTSEILTLANHTQNIDELPLEFDSVTNGTGSSTYVAAGSYSDLATAASGDYVVEQTFERYRYLAGKSMQILLTLANFQAETNVTKRVGYFSSATTGDYDTAFDGLYLQSDTDVSIEIMRGGTSIASVAQSSWNIDQLDGTGPSGYTADWSKAQIILIDYEWLGVGRVRFGFISGGGVTYFHEVLNANSVTQPYMVSPNQPVRYEIRQTGAGSGSLRRICSAVGVEGTTNQRGFPHATDTGATGFSGSSGTAYAVLGLRLASTALDASIDIHEINAFISGINDTFRWQLCRNPTIAGSFTYSAVANASIESAVGTASNTVSDCGTALISGYGTNEASSELHNDEHIALGAAIDGTAIPIVLVVTPISASTTVFGAAHWEER